MSTKRERAEAKTAADLRKNFGSTSSVRMMLASLSVVGMSVATIMYLPSIRPSSSAEWVHAYLPDAASAAGWSALVVAVLATVLFPWRVPHPFVNAAGVVSVVCSLSAFGIRLLVEGDGYRPAMTSGVVMTVAVGVFYAGMTAVHARRLRLRTQPRTPTSTAA